MLDVLLAAGQALAVLAGAGLVVWGAWAIVTDPQPLIREWWTRPSDTREIPTHEMRDTEG